MRKVLLFIGVFLSLMLMLTGCSQAGKYVKEGKKNFADGDYEKAATNFSAAIAANPGRADYYINYGMALTALGNYEEALNQFDKAYVDKDMLIIKENNKKVLRAKGIVYYCMQQYDKAIDEFEKALKIDELPGIDVDILYYMADSLKTTGSYEEAEKAYTSILSRDDKNSLAYAKRAGTYQCMGEYEKSLADYDRAISLKPKNYGYYFGKYYMMTENNDGAGAAQVLSQAEKIQAKTPEDQYNLAKLHFYQEKYDAALSELSESYTGGFTEAYYYIGEIYRIRKDYEKAIYYYENYMNTEVSSSNVYNQIAACLIKLGSYQDALEYLKQGMAYMNAGTSLVLLKNEIIAFENLGRYEDADKKMDEYLTKYPEDGESIKEAGFITTRVNEEGITD